MFFNEPSLLLFVKHAKILLTLLSRCAPADGAAGDGVLGGREDAVDDLVGLADVDEVRRALDLVEVERDLAGNGAVEPGLQEGRPAVVELVRAAAVVLADPRDARVDALKTYSFLGTFYSGKWHRLCCAYCDLFFF